MKKALHIGLVILLSLLLKKTNAQMGDDAIFLQGCFIEVAISDCGAYGTAEDPPTGPYGEYHEIDWNGLGFVADHEKDGWDVATGPGEPDFCGDYFAPGSPEEGWAIQIGSDIYENHYIGCDGYGFGGDADIDGDVVEYIEEPGYKQGVWEGTLDDDGYNLAITQTTTFPNGALFFVTGVEICNNGDTDIEDLYYMRNVDPDQDLDHCGTFGTENEIIYNPPTDDTALVTAIGDICDCYLGIGAIDDRARVSYGNFFISPATPEGGWMGDIGEGYYDSGSISCDCAIQITFQLDIPVGECETIYFAHVLDQADLSIALQATLTGGFVGVSADGVEVDVTGIVEKCELDTLTLEILNAEQYDWTWTPSYGLNVDTGTSVICYTDTTTIYYIHGVGECGELFDTITINVHEVEGNANAGPDTYVCPDDTITLEGSGGVTYLWQPPVYLEDPTDPNTAVLNPLTDMYYFLIAFDDIGCPDTASVFIDLKERPDVNAGPDKVMPLGTFTQLSGSGAETYSWTPGSTLNDSTVYNPIASPTDTTQYFLTGWDEFGCENWDSVWVYVIDPAYIENPNVFSPNEDGINDYYIPHVEGLGELLDYQIYSRWGDLVYDWNLGDRGWDGTYLGKKQEVATYIVVITAYDSVKRIELQKTANVILMR